MITAILLAAFACSASQTHAGPITNGDFSDAVDLAGYTATGAVVGEPTGEFGQLETDGDFLRTLEQTFKIPSVPSTLTFDFAFSTEATSSSAFFVDAFAASVITTLDGDFLDILVVDLFGPLPDPSDGIEGFTGAVPIDVDYDPSVTITGFVPFSAGATYTGRVSMMLPSVVLGEEATIYFDLFDEFDAANSIAAIDNIAIEPKIVAVPEPSTLVLLGIGGGALLVMARRKKRPPAA